MNQSTSKSSILTTVQMKFHGISHVRYATEDSPSNILYFLTDTNRKKQPKIKAVVQKPLQFLEILQGFFTCVKKGLLYQSSDSEMKKKLDGLKKKKGIELYSKMFSYAKDEKEAGKIGLDPLLTIRNGVCYLEAFDKKSDKCLMLRLNPSIWQPGGEFEDGEAAINLTPDFIAAMSGINTKDPVHVHVGPNVGNEKDTSLWKGNLEKTFLLDLEDTRALLVMQGTGALSVYNVEMVRIDFFNILRTLRMNKAKTHKSFNENKEPSDIVFQLEPGKMPSMKIEPWGYEIPCQTEKYNGKRMEISVGGKRRNILPLNRLLPFVSNASFTLFESSLHYCLDVGNEDFQCSVVLSGFGPKVWYRRLQMETMLPTFAERSKSEVAENSLLQQLDTQGFYTLSEEQGLRDRKVLISEILRGNAVFLPAQQTFIKRSLFDTILDMEKLKVLGSQDTKARSYLNNGNVTMKTHYRRDEKLDFAESTVRENLKHGESEAFVATPSFLLDTDGVLQVPSCNCAFFKITEGNGFGGPCAHLRALWLNYCQEIEAIREAKDSGEDTGPALQEEKRFVKKSEERVIKLDVRRKYFLSESWKKSGMDSFRHSTQVYSTEERVRQAFADRCSYLQNRGFDLSQ